MFYPYLLNISQSDVVLEVGPGAYPYWRSDCLADKFDNNFETDISQFGGAPQQTKGKPLFLLEDSRLPFKDKVFDYLICSHVLEHVPFDELTLFASELSRVAKRTYIEVPRPAYDLVYDFDVHLNLMDIVAGSIVCLPKVKTNLHQTKLFTKYALELRKSQGFAIELVSVNAIAVGKEFSGQIPIIICENEDEFFERISNNIVQIPPPTLGWKLKQRLARLKYKYVQKHYSKKEFSSFLICR